ncbi:MAG: GntR family transcriptional regulator [Streptosporangiaceae bacterium]
MNAAAAESVYEAIRSDILNARLLPGVVISESALAVQLGVSRTPIREALFRLEQDGLLTRGPRGMEVRERSPEEILDIYEVRSALEAVASRDAAQRRRDIDVATLTRLNREFAETVQDVTIRESGVAEANLAFHQAIWQTARNAACLDALTRLQAHLGRYSGTTLTAPGRGSAAVEEHSAILDAIIRQDREAAGTLAAEHMSKAKQVRLLLFTEDLAPQAAANEILDMGYQSKNRIR